MPIGQTELLGLIPKAEEALRFVHRRVRWMDIDELRGEAYLILVRCAQIYDASRGPVAPFVYQMVRWQLFVYLRNLTTKSPDYGPRSMSFDIAAPVLQFTGRIDERICRRQVAQLVRRAVSRLPTKDQETASDIMAGLSQIEAGKLRNKSGSTIFFRRNRLRRLLRPALALIERTPS